MIRDLAVRTGHRLGIAVTAVSLALAVLMPVARASATIIDSYDCYGAFCLEVKGVLQQQQTPTGIRQLVSNARATAWFYEGGEITWTDTSFANQHYLIVHDNVVLMNQVYFDVAKWEDGTKYCFAYVWVMRNGELIVENVTRQTCGAPG